MIRAKIMTPYTVRRTAQILADYPHPAIEICNDITGRDAAMIIPEVNAYVVEVVAGAETIALIEADPHYQVLTSEEIPDEITA